MGDLISRKSLLDNLNRFAPECYNALVNSLIEKEPAVDAVPVVRCKDCKHWGVGVAGETERVKCCEYGRYMVGENGYCVYGEKKE